MTRSHFISLRSFALWVLLAVSLLPCRCCCAPIVLSPSTALEHNTSDATLNGTLEIIIAANATNAVVVIERSRIANISILVTSVRTVNLSIFLLDSVVASSVDIVAVSMENVEWHNCSVYVRNSTIVLLQSNASLSGIAAQQSSVLSFGGASSSLSVVGLAFVVDNAVIVANRTSHWFNSANGTVPLANRNASNSALLFAPVTGFALLSMNVTSVRVEVYAGADANSSNNYDASVPQAASLSSTSTIVLGNGATATMVEADGSIAIIGYAENSSIRVNNWTMWYLEAFPAPIEEDVGQTVQSNESIPALLLRSSKNLVIELTGVNLIFNRTTRVERRKNVAFCLVLLAHSVTTYATRGHVTSLPSLYSTNHSSLTLEFSDVNISAAAAVPNGSATMAVAPLPSIALVSVLESSVTSNSIISATDVQLELQWAVSSLDSDSSLTPSSSGMCGPVAAGSASAASATATALSRTSGSAAHRVFLVDIVRSSSIANVKIEFHNVRLKTNSTYGSSVSDSTQRQFIVSLGLLRSLVVESLLQVTVVADGIGHSYQGHGHCAYAAPSFNATYAAMFVLINNEEIKNCKFLLQNAEMQFFGSPSGLPEVAKAMFFHKNVVQLTNVTLYQLWNIGGATFDGGSVVDSDINVLACSINHSSLSASSSGDTTDALLLFSGGISSVGVDATIVRCMVQTPATVAVLLMDEVALLSITPVVIRQVNCSFLWTTSSSTNRPPVHAVGIHTMQGELISVDVTITGCNFELRDDSANATGASESGDAGYTGFVDVFNVSVSSLELTVTATTFHVLNSSNVVGSLLAGILISTSTMNDLLALDVSTVTFYVASDALSGGAAMVSAYALKVPSSSADVVWFISSSEIHVDVSNKSLASTAASQYTAFSVASSELNVLHRVTLTNVVCINANVASYASSTVSGTLSVILSNATSRLRAPYGGLVDLSIRGLMLSRSIAVAFFNVSAASDVMVSISGMRLVGHVGMLSISGASQFLKTFTSNVQSVFLQLDDGDSVLTVDGALQHLIQVKHSVTVVSSVLMEVKHVTANKTAQLVSPRISVMLLNDSVSVGALTVTLTNWTYGMAVSSKAAAVPLDVSLYGVAVGGSFVASINTMSGFVPTFLLHNVSVPSTAPKSMISCSNVWGGSYVEMHRSLLDVAAAASEFRLDVFLSNVTLNISKVLSTSSPTFHVTGTGASGSLSIGIDMTNATLHVVDAPLVVIQGRSLAHLNTSACTIDSTALPLVRVNVSAGGFRAKLFNTTIAGHVMGADATSLIAFDGGVASSSGLRINLSLATITAYAAADTPYVFNISSAAPASSVFTLDATRFAGFRNIFNGFVAASNEINVYCTRFTAQRWLSMTQLRHQRSATTLFARSVVAPALSCPLNAASDTASASISHTTCPSMSRSLRSVTASYTSVTRPPIPTDSIPLTDSVTSTITPPPTPSKSSSASAPRTLTNSTLITATFVTPPKTFTRSSTATHSETRTDVQSATPTATFRLSPTMGSLTTSVSHTDPWTPSASFSDSDSMSPSLSSTVTPTASASNTHVVSDTLSLSVTRMVSTTVTLSHSFNTSATLDGTRTHDLSATKSKTYDTRSRTQSSTVSPSQQTVSLAPSETASRSRMRSSSRSHLLTASEGTRSPTVTKSITPTRSRWTPTISRTCPMSELRVYPSESVDLFTMMKSGFPVNISTSEPLHTMLGSVEHLVQLSWGYVRSAVVTNLTTIALVLDTDAFVTLSATYTIRITLRGTLFQCAVSPALEPSATTFAVPKQLPLGKTITGATQTAVASTAVPASVIAGASGGAALQRASLQLKLIVCEFSLSEPLDLSSSPTQIGFGDARGYYIRGSVVGNIAVLIGLGCLCVMCIAIRLYFGPRPLLPLHHAAGSLALPGWLIVPVASLIQPLSMSSIALLWNSEVEDPVTDVSVGLIGVVACVLLTAAISYITSYGFCAVAIVNHSTKAEREKARLAAQRQQQRSRRRNSSPASTSSSSSSDSGDDDNDHDVQKNEAIMLQNPSHLGWITKREFEWVDASDGLRFVKRYGPIFDVYRRDRHWFIVVEIVVSILNGIAGGVTPNHEELCEPVLIGLTVVSGLFLLAIVLLWPYNSRVLQVVQLLNASLAFVWAVLVFSDSAPTMVIGALSAAQVWLMVLCVAASFLDIIVSQRVHQALVAVKANLKAHLAGGNPIDEVVREVDKKSQRQHEAPRPAALPRTVNVSQMKLDDRASAVALDHINVTEPNNTAPPVEGLEVARLRAAKLRRERLRNERLLSQKIRLLEVQSFAALSSSISRGEQIERLSNMMDCVRLLIQVRASKADDDAL